MRKAQKTAIFLRRCVRISTAGLLVLICTAVGAAYWPANDPGLRQISSSIPAPRNELIYSLKHDDSPHVPAKASLHTKRIVWMEVTAYCPCKKCCGPHAKRITASGKTVRFNGGKFVAADTDRLPFGTKLSIPGYHGGQAVPVIDTGYAIRGNRLDVFFPDHATAVRWGVKWLPVVIEN